MTKGSKVIILALGALVSVAASPAVAQMVIGGGERPSVDVNWDVLDKLGPEPTLPGLLTRQPDKAAAAPGHGVVFKPYGGHAEAKPAAPKHVRPVKQAATAPTTEAPTTETGTAKPVKPAAETAAVPEIPGVPPAEKVAASPQPAKPAKADLAVDVPPPPKMVKPGAESKVKTVAAPPPAAAEVRAKVEPAPAPSAVQFVKTPEPPKPIAPPVAAAPPVVQPPAAPPQVAVAPPVAVVAPPPVAVPPPVAIAPPPAVQPPAAPPQVASVAPSMPNPLRKGDNLTVLFASDSDHLPESANGDLEKLAKKMGQDESLTLQLLAYAAADEANASNARRLSLTRALRVRTYLMELGVRSTRIEVRALGNKIEGGPADRVDLVLGSR